MNPIERISHPLKHLLSFGFALLLICQGLLTAILVTQVGDVTQDAQRIYALIETQTVHCTSDGCTPSATVHIETSDWDTVEGRLATIKRARERIWSTGISTIHRTFNGAFSFILLILGIALLVRVFEQFTFDRKFKMGGRITTLW